MATGEKPRHGGNGNIEHAVRATRRLRRGSLVDHVDALDVHDLLCHVRHAVCERVRDVGRALCVGARHLKGDHARGALTRHRDVVAAKVREPQLIGRIGHHAVALQKRGDVVREHLARRKVAGKRGARVAPIARGEHVHVGCGGVRVVHHKHAGKAHGHHADDRKHDHQLEVLPQEG